MTIGQFAILLCVLYLVLLFFISINNRGGDE